MFQNSFVFSHDVSSTSVKQPLNCYEVKDIELSNESFIAITASGSLILKYLSYGKSKGTDTQTSLLCQAVTVER